MPGHMNRVYGFPVVTSQERLLSVEEVVTICPSEDTDGTLVATHRPLALDTEDHGVPTRPLHRSLDGQNLL